MKASKILAASILALTSATLAHADTVLHITGSTAFRGATIVAIENVLGGAGNFKAAYAGSASTNGEQGATYVILQGTIASQPALGVVTVKCAWGGSTGGIKTLDQNLDIQGSVPNGWLSIANLPATNIITAGATNYALDTATFPAENNKADVTMEDSLKTSVGFN